MTSTPSFDKWTVDDLTIVDEISSCHVAPAIRRTEPVIQAWAKAP